MYISTFLRLLKNYQKFFNGDEKTILKMQKNVEKRIKTTIPKMQNKKGKNSLKNVERKNQSKKCSPKSV